MSALLPVGFGHASRRLRAAGEKIRIEDVVQEAAEKFGKSDVTIRRAWQRFGQQERLQLGVVITSLKW